jgi:uncharacterized membrane protein
LTNPISTSIRLVALAAALAVTGAAANAAPSYSCKALSDSTAMFFEVHTFATAINGRNEVLGSGLGELNGSDSFGVMRWDKTRQGQRLQDAVTPGTNFSYPGGLNDAGLIVGTVQDNDGKSHATQWVDGVPSYLGELPGTRYSSAEAVNRKGKVVGRSVVELPDGTVRTVATLWNHGVAVDLGGVGQFSSSAANDINDAGVVVGVSDDYAVRWDGKKATRLKHLPGTTHSVANAINVGGLAVGWSNKTVEPATAAAWVGGEVQALQGLPNHIHHFAEDVNTAGVVVGSSGNAANEYTAIMWPNVNAAPLDLNKLVAGAGCVDAFGDTHRLNWVIGINDKGAIVAEAADHVGGGNRSFVFLLIPK